MRISEKGIELIKAFEGYRGQAYLCSAGIATLGWGHTKGVKLGDTCTREQAHEWLLQDIQSAVNSVNRLIKVELTQSQFDALVSFCYNLGSGALQRSTLRQKLNRGDYHGAGLEFLKWCKAKGKTLNGLLRRRKAEMQLFMEFLQ